MANAYPQADILALCRKYGPQLRVPQGINGAALMVAIASNESSIGANCEPRYERNYDRGGLYDQGDQATLLDQYGKAAACSYGPWQVMAVNALPLTPPELADDPEACAHAFVAFFNAYVMAHRKASDLEEIAQVYNAGHISKQKSLGVDLYIRNLSLAYTRALKEASSVPSAQSIA